jgi:hypothetical protein
MHRETLVVISHQTDRTIRTHFFRLSAYLLAFASGAAAMFAFYQVPVKPEVAQSNQQSQPTFPTANASPEQVDEQPQVEVVDTRAPETKIDTPATEESAKPDDAPPKELQTSEVVVAMEAIQSLCVTGVTEPAAGRFAKLSLATNQAIAFVDVKPGDRVKKGWQVFSHWESPERLQAMKTELEKTKKVFNVAQTRATAAKQTVERLRKIEKSVSAQQLQDAETMSTIRQGELETAELAVAEAESRFTALEFEFSQAFVTSPIDGVVASVDVIQGERRQVGTGFRGVTILDPRVLYCRCMVNQQQLATLERLASQSATQTAAAQTAVPDVPADPSREVKKSLSQRLQTTVEADAHDRPATIISVGLQADLKTGLIPIILELQNSDESLRSGVAVNVCFRAM